MNKRLQQFLSAENISQAQFADTIDVARASVSHVLAGRNKPGYDFIKSISEHYPKLSLDWLINGKGKMYRDTAATSTLASMQPSQAASLQGSVAPAQQLADQAMRHTGIVSPAPGYAEPIYEEDDLFAPRNGFPTDGLRINTAISTDINTPSQAPHVPANQGQVTDAQQIPANQGQALQGAAYQSRTDVTQGQAGQMTDNPGQGLRADKAPRAISRIVVFYDDGTYQELK